jgi:hypothetical protein
MTRKPKPRCRVRGFVEEMGAFLQRPMCMSLEGGANRPRPPNNENSDGFQCEKLSRSRSGGSGFSRRWGQHSVRIWHGLTLGRAAGRLHSSRLRMRTSHLASGHELKRPLLRSTPRRPQWCHLVRHSLSRPAASDGGPKTCIYRSNTNCGQNRHLKVLCRRGVSF